MAGVWESIEPTACLAGIEDVKAVITHATSTSYMSHSDAMIGFLG